MTLVAACAFAPSAVARESSANGQGNGIRAEGTVSEEHTATADGAPELTAAASQAIDRGLKQLLSVQRKDGSLVRLGSKGEGSYAVGITSLALMAFMANAHFPGFGPYGAQLDRAKEYLLQHAKSRPDGYLGTTMYEHGLATLALSELWGMTKNRKDDDAIQKALEAAVAVIVRSQNPDGGGWRYQPVAQNMQDTSVTAMVFVSLASARQAGVVVPNVTIKRVIKYLEGAYSPEAGGFSYAPMGSKRQVTNACTAGGAYSAQLAGQRDTEIVKAAIRFLKKAGMAKHSGHYYYAHYYAIQAMVQAGDKEYAEWYPQIRDALIARQKKDGSWGAGHETPMAIITLSTPHRYIPIYQR
jgi:squalene cyclase